VVVQLDFGPGRLNAVSHSTGLASHIGGFLCTGYETNHFDLCIGIRKSENSSSNCPYSRTPYEKHLKDTYKSHSYTCIWERLYTVTNSCIVLHFHIVIALAVTCRFAQ